MKTIKLTKKQLTYIDHLTFDRFHDLEAKKQECESILNFRLELGLEIEDNYMIADFYDEFRVEFKPTKN